MHSAAQSLPNLVPGDGYVAVEGEGGGAQVYPFTFFPDQFRSLSADLHLIGWIVPGPFEEMNGNNLTEDIFTLL
ncbi:hypothetical protein [Mameliella sp. MMSF_3455]|uniref:hypothetical protein n=1 Tax=Mameliella sp. MMSF_3455 TaxID=3046714 RepID=UPI00273FDC1F|nr:hypothetical protein [Mameliella sp. MMSF_3455]